MISIIICSVDSKRLDLLKKNIDRTIGVPYEIIVIENSKNLYGICSAYNEGGKKSIFPFLCFMHEDVMIDTENWGILVCKYLSNPTIGLIGVAGGDAKSLVPSSWSVPVYSNEISIIQHCKYTQQEPKKIRTTRNASNSASSQVVVLDGVWMCTRKEIFDQFRFDEKMLKGFHGYDIDFSLQVGSQYKLLVVFDVELHHYSEGSPGKEWLDASIAISNKWKQQLPVSIYTDKVLLREHHWRSMQVFLQHLDRLNINTFLRLRLFLNYSFNSNFHLRRFLSMCKYLLIGRSNGESKN